MNMRKNTLLAILDINNTIIAIFIVSIAVIFNNYWLLFLLLFCGVSKTIVDGAETR